MCADFMSANRDITLSYWLPFSFGNQPPPARFSHSVSVYIADDPDDDRLVVSGGRRYESPSSDRWDLLQDLWLFDFERFVWKALIPAETPSHAYPSRAYHTTAVWNGIFLSHGGYSRIKVDRQAIGAPEQHYSYVFNDLLTIDVERDAAWLNARESEQNTCLHLWGDDDGQSVEGDKDHNHHHLRRALTHFDVLSRICSLIFSAVSQACALVILAYCEAMSSSYTVDVIRACEAICGL